MHQIMAYFLIEIFHSSIEEEDHVLHFGKGRGVLAWADVWCRRVLDFMLLID